MPKELKKNFLLTILTLLLPFAAMAFPDGSAIAEHSPARNVVWNGKLQRNIGFLADSICQGRATGSRGNTEAAFRLFRQFEKAGLKSFDSTFVKHFYAGKGLVGHNIVGLLPGSTKYPCDRYVIIGAHYDHLGMLDGKLYPGADANASGVVAMTSLADMFSAMKTLGKSYGRSIIFVAFDAKELDMAGSCAFWKSLCDGQLTDPVSGKTITPDKISLMVNIDQLGSTLSPVHKGREEYLIMLGTESLPKEKRDALKLCNMMYSTGLDIALDYYGSETFTRIFYRLSDQKVFVDNNVPSVLFTSGITMNTNKTRDTTENLSIETLKKRIWLIYHWLTKML